MATRMVTVKLDPSDAELSKVRARLGLQASEIDSNFGVVTLNAAKHLYAILVDEDVANRIEGTEGVVGTYSNPRIETFGPPEPQKKPRG